MGRNKTFKFFRKRKKKVEDSSEKSNSSTSTDCKTSDSSSLSPNIVDMEGRVFNVGTLPLRNPQYTATVKSKDRKLFLSTVDT